MKFKYLSGGIWNYENMLEILKNPEHEEYGDTVEWLEEDFDPEYFDPKDVSFQAGKVGNW